MHSPRMLTFFNNNNKYYISLNMQECRKERHQQLKFSKIFFFLKNCESTRDYLIGIIDNMWELFIIDRYIAFWVSRSLHEITLTQKCPPDPPLQGGPPTPSLSEEALKVCNNAETNVSQEMNWSSSDCSATRK